ncbi:MAG: hypothetical protein JO197_11895 [Acidobacteria bacterium]|nr:hypothetical protein [Acidobacteriota bacterium]MBV9476179.1 hypothetical protein [Acidobacteriota bacterium]
MREDGAATCRHFDITVERMERRFDLLADLVRGLDEKFDRRLNDLENRVNGGFDDLRLFTRLTYSDIDRRVRALEVK